MNFKKRYSKFEKNMLYFFYDKKIKGQKTLIIDLYIKTKERHSDFRGEAMKNYNQIKMKGDSYAPNKKEL